MSSKTAIGIDYSMTCPAVCVYSTAAVRFWYAHETKVVTTPVLDCYQLSKSGSTTERATRLARKVLDWLDTAAPNCREVSIEDYAFAATGRVFHIGENTGILKYFFETEAIVYHPIPPTVIKKFATGKGNADKIKMTAAFLEAYPDAQEWALRFFPRSPDGAQEPCKWAKSPLADLADAYWIARYAYNQ